MDEIYIDQLITSGRGRALSPNWSHTIDAHLNRYSWIGSHIAWHELPGVVRLAWGLASDAEATRFMMGTTLAVYPELAVFYGRRYPVLALQRDWALRNLPVVAANSQQFFLFGCLSDAPVLEAFAELETVDTIWAFAGAPVATHE